MFKFYKKNEFVPETINVFFEQKNGKSIKVKNTFMQFYGYGFYYKFRKKIHIVSVFGNVVKINGKNKKLFVHPAEGIDSVIWHNNFFYWMQGIFRKKIDLQQLIDYENNTKGNQND